MRTEDNKIELGHYRRAPGDASNGERLKAIPEELDEIPPAPDVVLLEENEAGVSTTQQVDLSRRGAAPPAARLRLAKWRRLAQGNRGRSPLLSPAAPACQERRSAEESGRQKREPIQRRRSRAMAGDENWFDICSLEEASNAPLRRVKAANMEFAVSFQNEKIGVVSNACNHVGGLLGEGRLDGEYIVCPWHNWKFHRCTGIGEPGFEQDCVPAYPVKVENGRVLVDLNAVTKRKKTPHEPHPLARRLERAPGPLRLAGIATTVMDASNPRFSGSDHVLAQALEAAEKSRR
ncbi:MAG: Rieske 2Fe-2S domain-containing protein [Methylocystis sp.]